MRVAYDESKINMDSARLNDGTGVTSLYNGSAETTIIQVPTGPVDEYRLPVTAAVTRAKIR